MGDKSKFGCLRITDEVITSLDNLSSQISSSYTKIDDISLQRDGDELKLNLSPSKTLTVDIDSKETTYNYSKQQLSVDGYCTIFRDWVKHSAVDQH